MKKLAIKEEEKMASKTLPIAETADQLFASDRREEVVVELPGLGLSVVVVEPDAEKIAYLSRISRDKDGKFDSGMFDFNFVYESIVKPVFQPNDLGRLKKLSGSAFSKIRAEIGKKKDA